MKRRKGTDQSNPFQPERTCVTDGHNFFWKSQLISSSAYIFKEIKMVVMSLAADMSHVFSLTLIYFTLGAFGSTIKVSAAPGR